MNKPQISILLAVHNGRNYLAQAVRSVLEQDCDPDLWELIIGFNGCNRENLDYNNTVIFPMTQGRNVRFLSYEEKGKALTLNKLLKEANGSWIAIQDHDDVWLPTKLTLQMRALLHRDHAGTDVLGTWYNCMNASGNPLYDMQPALSHSSIKEQCGAGKNQVGNTTVIIRRKALEKAAGWREKWEGVEDYDLWLRMLNAGYVFGNLPYVTVFHRIHAESNFNTQKYDLEKLIAEAAIFTGQHTEGTDKE